MPDGGLSAEQLLRSESPAKPRGVRIASALCVGYAVLGLIGGLWYVFLVQDNYTPAQWVVPGLFGVTLWLWVGAKLLQLRHWALIAGRVLAVPSVVIFLIALATGRFAVDPPILIALRLGQLAVALALAISLFLPGVTTAFKQPPDSTEHWIRSRTR
jgi:hypothetical protein